LNRPQRHDFSVRFARPVVVALAENSSLVHEDCANQGIGKRETGPLGRKVKGALHEQGVGSHCAKVQPYLCCVTWRGLQLAFIAARSGFEAGEANAQWRRWIEAKTGRSFARIALEALDQVPAEILAEFYRCEAELNSLKPIQQILGFEYFDGIKFNINSNVLIPRPETEELVAEAARRAPHGASVLDLGTGSGCIALALKNRRPDLHVTGVDSAQEALAVAAQNEAMLKLGVSWCWGDLRQAPPEGLRAELILSNPPYITPDEDLAPEVRDYEPHLALFAPEGDPLYYYRRVLDWAQQLGALQLGFECHRTYAADVAQAAVDAGWDAHGSLDQFGAPRWVWAQKSRP
jgi:release factor glutamine methyltransferase